MKKPKLYIRKPNGRYEPYKEPAPEFDNVLYRKRGNKYVDWGMDLRYNELDEEVWVITKRRGCHTYASGNSLYNYYVALKCGDIIEAPSLAELGGYEKLAGYLLENWDKVDKTCIDTMCKTIVSILMRYEREKRK